MAETGATAGPDWASLPRPVDDGGADHLLGRTLPDVRLPSSRGGDVALRALHGLVVLYLYPMTGRPGRALPEGWDDIPGARGCTPQGCAFRDHFDTLCSLGAAHVFGVSTQSTEEQGEAAGRLHLPFPLLSDAAGRLAAALALPTMEVEGRTMLKRLTMIARHGRIEMVRYPVFPPDTDAAAVADWLRANA
jgi:peroxiredoxin